MNFYLFLFYIMNNLLKIPKDYVLRIANIKYPNIRKRKYDLSYYFDMFCALLSDYVKLSSLKTHISYKGNRGNNDYHYKTIENEYRKWFKDNVFEEAYTLYLNERYVCKNKKINVFIDATTINNKHGRECIGKYTENKKHSVTRLSTITDVNKCGLSIIPLKLSGKLYKDKNNKLHKSKYFEHEINKVQETLNNIRINIKDIDVNLIGDRGYITSTIFMVNHKPINIVTPKRSNQKKQNTSVEKQLLKKRSVIENFFCDLKKHERICLREDHLIKNFLGFVYMACLINMCNKHK